MTCMQLTVHSVTTWRNSSVFRRPWIIFYSSNEDAASEDTSETDEASETEDNPDQDPIGTDEETSDEEDARGDRHLPLEKWKHMLDITATPCKIFKDSTGYDPRSNKACMFSC